MVRTRAFMLASSIPFPQQVVCIKDEASLEKHNAAARHNRAVTDAISSLEIRFVNPFPQFIDKARRLFPQLNYIDTLILKLPRVSARECSLLLKNLDLPNLTFFSADSLPHDGVIAFLVRNPGVTTIFLSNLARCKCATGPSLTPWEISGPTICMATLVRGHPAHRVTAAYRRPSDTHAPLFASLALSPANLLYLHLDFSAAHDMNILESIVASAPFLETLKLNEKFSGGCEYPWDNSARWRTGLLALASLSRLSVRTRAPLVQRPGSQAHERRLVSSWSGEAQNFPLQLTQVTIWYRWEEEESYASIWCRGHLRRRWERQVSQRKPEIHF